MGTRSPSGRWGRAPRTSTTTRSPRQGWGDDVAEVQRLWREGDRAAAAARVPIEIGLGTNLIGPIDTVRDRLREYRDCGVNTLRVNPIGSTLDERVAGLGQLMDLVEEINDEPVDAAEGVHS